MFLLKAFRFRSIFVIVFSTLFFLKVQAATPRPILELLKSKFTTKCLSIGDTFNVSLASLINADLSNVVYRGDFPTNLEFSYHESTTGFWWDSPIWPGGDLPAFLSSKFYLQMRKFQEAPAEVGQSFYIPTNQNILFKVLYDQYHEGPLESPYHRTRPIFDEYPYATILGGRVKIVVQASPRFSLSLPITAYVPAKYSKPRSNGKCSYSRL